jgi:hypothetical protein
VRATLHDELMREAGFESAYLRELERGRERRRRKLRVALRRAARFVVLTGALTGSAAWIAEASGTSVSPVLLFSALVVAGVGAVVDLILETTRDDADERRGVLWAWKRLTRRRETENHL